MKKNVLYLPDFDLGELTVEGWKRFLGILPLMFTVTHFLESWKWGQAGNILWVCHVSGAILGLGFLLRNKELIQMSSLWIAIGIPLWIIDLAYTHPWLLTSFFSHIGNFTLSIFGIYIVGTGKYAWVYSSLYFYAFQLLARIFTDPKLNVNVSHRIYDGTSSVFTSYWTQWLVIFFTVPVGLWIVNRGLSVAIPKRKQG